MMNKLLFALSIMVLLSCSENSSKNKNSETDNEIASNHNNYPDAFIKVLKAGGGLDAWKKQRTLIFEIPDSGGYESHVTDLITRKDKTSNPDFEMGYNGKEVWLLDKKGNYSNNAVFMHDLMFYFFAMPFVLADKGLNYETAEDLEVDGKSYPGIKITFQAGVGESPKDEYYLHYDPETYKMTWLGYKATFGSSEMPENTNWINYNEWNEVDGILLPASITWHTVENGKIKEAKKTVNFEKVLLSKSAKSDSFYEKPENAVVVGSK